MAGHPLRAGAYVPEADGLPPWLPIEHGRMIFDEDCRMEKIPAVKTAKNMLFLLYKR